MPYDSSEGTNTYQGNSFDFCVKQLQEGACFLPLPMAAIDAVFCGCGDPDSSWDWIAGYLLKIINQQWDELSPTEQIVAYLLDHLGLTEHGTTIRCCWLTDKGMIVLGFLCRWGSDWQKSIDEVWWVDIEGVTRSLVG